MLSLLSMSEFTAERSSVHTEQLRTRANCIQVLYSEDLGTRIRYLRQGYIIASHRILWDAITYPCLRYLPLVLIYAAQPAVQAKMFICLDI